MRLNYIHPLVVPDDEPEDHEEFQKRRQDEISRPRVGSDPSLSEVPDDEPEDYEGFQKRLEDEIHDGPEDYEEFQKGLEDEISRSSTSRSSS